MSGREYEKMDSLHFIIIELVDPKGSSKRRSDRDGIPYPFHMVP